jgi:hypothetical protein
MFNRNRFSFVSALVVGLVAVACSSSSGGGAGSSSSASKCPASYTTSNTSCSQADLDAYAACPHQQCGDQLDACKGACQAQVDCVSACACDDTACRTKCVASDDCKTCMVGAAKCTVQKCPQPACMKGASSGGTSSGASGGTSSGGTSSGSSGGTSSGGTSSGGTTDGGTSSGSSGGTTACTDLQTCCNKIPASDSDKTLCNDTVANDPASCASELAYYQGAGKC